MNHTTAVANGGREGRVIQNLSVQDRFIPYYVRSPQAAQNFYEDLLDLTDAEVWLRSRAIGEFANLNLLHLVLAAYVRTVAVMPGINRYVSGGKLYARNGITVVISAAKNESDRRSARFVKVDFTPNDTIYDVYRKVGAAVQQLKAGNSLATATPFPESLLKMPRPFIHFAFWCLRKLDEYDRLPVKYRDCSPYHSSLLISSLAAHGVRPTYMSLGDFGHLPMSLSISTNTMGDRQALSFRVVYDSRVADVYYFTEAFKYFKQVLSNPALLEQGPETVFEDIF